jgi:hypothetical protein
MYLPDPYPTRNHTDVRRLGVLGYPINVVCLIYPQFEDTVCDHPLSTEIWLHPGQDYNCPLRMRASGHDILRELLRTSNLCRAATFHELRYYTLYPELIPREWFQYSHILAWKGIAKNKSDDMVVPALYTKGDRPTIHWIPLSLIMHAGEGTLLHKRVSGD